MFVKEDEVTSWRTRGHVPALRGGAYTARGRERRVFARGGFQRQSGSEDGGVAGLHTLRHPLDVIHSRTVTVLIARDERKASVVWTRREAAPGRARSLDSAGRLMSAIRTHLGKI